MRKIHADKARDYFAERVKTNAKTLLDMGDIIRKHPGEFKLEDVGKVRAFLLNQVNAALVNMETAIKGAVRTEFTFDMEVPPAPVFQDRSEISNFTRNEARQELEARAVAAPAQQPQPPQRGPVPMREKPAGRLFGTKEVVKELVPAIPVKSKSEFVPLTAEHDNTGMISNESGFITE